MVLKSGDSEFSNKTDNIVLGALAITGLTADLIFFFMMLYAKFTERTKKFPTFVKAVGESLLSFGVALLGYSIEEKYGKGSITVKILDMLAWLLTLKGVIDMTKGLRQDPYQRVSRSWKGVGVFVVIGSFGAASAYLGIKYGEELFK